MCHAASKSESQSPDSGVNIQQEKSSNGLVPLATHFSAFTAWADMRSRLHAGVQGTIVGTTASEAGGSPNIPSSGTNGENLSGNRGNAVNLSSVLQVVNDS